MKVGEDVTEVDVPEFVKMLKRLTEVMDSTRRELYASIDLLEQRVTAIEKYHNLSPKESPKLGGIVGMEQVHERREGF